MNIKKLLRILFVVIIISISFYYISRSIITNTEALIQAKANINYALLLCSIGVTTVCVVLGGWEWKLLLTALGHDLSTRQGLRIHLRSNVAKYVPGFAWHIVGKTYLCRQAHIPSRYITVAVGFEFVSMILTAFLAALVVLPGVDFVTMSSQERWTVYGLAFLGGGIIFLGLPLGLQTVIQTIDREGDWKIRWWGISLTLIVMFFNWLLWGLGFCALIAAIHPVRSAQIPTFIFTLTSSFVFSLLIIFVPNGIGVRESAMTFLLSTALPSSIAALIAIMIRLVMIVGELIGFVIALKL